MFGWTMYQKLLVDGFKLKNISTLDKQFIKNYNENSDKRYIFEADVEYLKDSHDLHSELTFLPERMKSNKCDKLVCNLYDEKTMLFI